MKKSILIGILIAVAVAIFIGVPVLPVLLVGSICQVLLAHSLTKNFRLCYVLCGMTLLAASTEFLLLPTLLSFLPAKAVSGLCSLLSHGMAVVSLLGATAIGLNGTRTRAL